MHGRAVECSGPELDKEVVWPKPENKVARACEDSRFRGGQLGAQKRLRDKKARLERNHYSSNHYFELDQPKR